MDRIYDMRNVCGVLVGKKLKERQQHIEDLGTDHIRIDF